MRSRLVALLCMAALAGCRKKPPQPVEVVVTSRAAEPGLAQTLAATFQQQSGVKMNLRVAPEEEALRLAETQGVQVVITNAPDAAQRYQRVSRLTAPFAFRDFALFGPKRDAAHVRTASSAAEALRRIAKKKARFCSAVDVAGVQLRERELWTEAGLDPKTMSRRSACHGDALAALREAEEKGAYTLAYSQTDTVAGIKMDIKLLLESEPRLHDDYAAVLVEHMPRIRRDKDAEWFVQWLMSYQGRDAVQYYRLDGVQPFSVRDAQGRR